MHATEILKQSIAITVD